MNEPSTNTRRQQEIERKNAKLANLRTRWNESERILNILRSQGAIELVPVSEEELIKWAKKDVPACTTTITWNPMTIPETG